VVSEGGLRHSGVGSCPPAAWGVGIYGRADPPSARAAPRPATVITGELSGAAAVDRAVQGADAVVSALGPDLDRKAAGLPLVEGTRTIIEAMQRHGVRRYVGNGT